MADMRRWLERGVDFGHVAVNAAAADFKRGDFAETILEGLHTCGIPPEHFQLEVTETVFLGRGAEYVERALKLLNTQGVRIALDDFGTGYASLTHLKQFPVHVVKIDRSFVSDSDSDPENAAIIRAVASLGRALGLEVVAEGVETASQRAYLTAHGCTIGQGYLFGKASPARRVPGIINSNAPLPADIAAFSGALRIADGR
jgi:EAL domain-containing protein (putative c-di-GMP-specific phosphodiesterase class I)